MGPNQYISSIRLKTPTQQQSYLSQLPPIRHLVAHSSLPFSAPVTFFVGENGTGKSTLIEAIAIAYGFNPEGGSKNFRFGTKNSHSELWEHLTLVKGAFAKDGFFLRAESLYNAAAYLEKLDEIPAAAPALLQSYGGTSLHSQSHGESFLSLVQNRFGGNGLYLLDEPEAALSPMRLLTLMAEIDRLVRQNSQFIIATHSPILMAFPGAQVLQFSQSGIHPIPYQETEHYQITRRFLENPQRMLRHLLTDDPPLD